MAEEYLEHDMPSEFHVSLSHNMLDVNTEDVEQFVVVHALKQKSIFQKDHAAIKSGNETLEDNDEWLLSEDSDGLDRDDEETSESGYEYDEMRAEIVAKT